MRLWTNGSWNCGGSTSIFVISSQGPKLIKYSDSNSTEFEWNIFVFPISTSQVNDDVIAWFWRAITSGRDVGSILASARWQGTGLDISTQWATIPWSHVTSTAWLRQHQQGRFTISDTHTKVTDYHLQLHPRKGFCGGDQCIGLPNFRAEVDTRRRVVVLNIVELALRHIPSPGRKIQDWHWLRGYWQIMHLC